MSNSVTDKKTIGLTSRGEEVMQEIMSLNYFKDMIDAAKFAMSLAINLNSQPRQLEGASTIWNIGSFDPEGELRQLIPVFYPDCTNPYRAVEYLINVGLTNIHEKIESSTLNIAEIAEQSIAI